MGAAMVTPARDAGFAALRHPAFGPFFVASSLWMMADNIEHVISYWVIFQRFNSPALAGFAVISHWAPFLFLGILMGALADRYDCRRIMHASLLAFIVASLGWAGLFFVGALEVWHAVVLLILHGFAGALMGPSSQMIIHDIVGPQDLQSAVRLSATGRSLGILFGPAVGGGLLLAFGPAMGLVLNVLIYMPLAIWLFRAPFTGHTRKAPDSVRAPALSVPEAVRALREVAGHRGILTMIALAGLTSLFIGNAYQAQMPQFAAAFPDVRGELGYSALLAASAAGAVLGGIALESSSFLRRPRARTAIVLAVAWCVVMLVFALTRTYWLAIAALFVAGVLNLGFTSMAQTLVQLEAPVDRRGRVIGLFNMSSSGLRVGSGVTVGLLAGVIGVHQALSASAIVLLAICLGLFAFTASRPVRRREAVETASASD